MSEIEYFTPEIRIINNVFWRKKQPTEVQKILKKWDPFQVFEVDHESCFDLEIIVHKGENVTKGTYLKDLLDTPDPYVVIRIPGSSNSSHRTTSIDNTVSPIWDQTFHFYLEPEKDHILYVILMDANYALDETLGEDTFTLNELEEDVPLDHTFIFPGGSKIFTTLTLQKNKKTDLRFSLALCEKEKECLRKRRDNVMISMQKLLGDKGPKWNDQVPVVAILGSGGGFRAMIGLSGAVKALFNSGILDCATYISGLSGSSWLISTLYSNDKFPSVTFDEIFQELKESVTHDWKINLLKFPFYCSDMIAKYRKGQPVSLTDFFGHLLGDVLLKERKNHKLSDQQEIVSKGIVPFPLYTCLHAKAAVSCKSFSEWVEFSPFEIGIAKYGTFMKTEEFGNKFLCGKKIKAFPEFPLHYLQGVWGSAFTILMKQHVLQGGSNKDPIQMMRDIKDEREFNERVEEECFNEESSLPPAENESDTEEENDIVGSDDDATSSSDEATPTQISAKESDEIISKSKMNEKLAAFDRLRMKKSTPAKNKMNGTVLSLEELTTNSTNNVVEISEKTRQTKQSLDSSFPRLDIINEASQQQRPRSKSVFTFSWKRIQDEKCGRKMSTHTEAELRVITGEDKAPGLQRKDAIKIQNNLSRESSKKKTKKWSDRRKTLRNQREEKSYFLQSLIKNTNVLKSRAGRAGEILNPFRGLSLRESFPLSPFSILAEEEEEESQSDIGMACRYDSLDNTAKKLFIVDSGLAFNSPYPLLLRPQRAVDIYLSFDFSQRPNDSFPPFNELLLAEKWAAQNKVPFPPIESKVVEYKQDTEIKEVYVFKHPTDPHCPVILHFPIVNNKFRQYKEPGVARTTKEEFDFADFSLFDDPTQPFSTYNFVYEDLHYERLVRLVEFNTLSCLDVIKDEFEQVVEKKIDLTKKSLASSVSKVQRVLRIAKKLKSSRHLNLQVNENKGKILISSLQQQTFFNRHRDISESSVETDDEFHDAMENLLHSEEKGTKL